MVRVWSDTERPRALDCTVCGVEVRAVAGTYGEGVSSRYADGNGGNGDPVEVAEETLLPVLEDTERGRNDRLKG